MTRRTSSPTKKKQLQIIDSDDDDRVACSYCYKTFDKRGIHIHELMCSRDIKVKNGPPYTFGGL